MPNWCENTLNIKFNNKKDMDKFLETYFTNDCFDFDKVIPEPKTLEECPKDYLILTKEDKDKAHIMSDDNRPWFNWYAWRLTHWGCKWSLSDSYQFIKNNTLSISFSTPWSPCLPVIKELSFNGLDYTFDYIYYEPGMCFAGLLRFNGINLIESEVTLYEDNVDYYQFLLDHELEPEEILSDPDWYNLEIINHKVIGERK